jgi:N-ethylmaleimide reductase
MLDISCARADYYQTSGRIIRQIRSLWPHLIMGGASLSVEQAEMELQSGYLDLVTWGRFILANPDFVTRIRNGQPLIPMDYEMLKTLV